MDVATEGPPRARRFVAVWPPEEVLAAVAELPRAGGAALRWTAPAQWHTTLAFLGEVADADRGRLEAVLAGVAEGARGPVLARLGPATRVLGAGVLVVPVAGLEELASAVAAGVAGWGTGMGGRAWAGHLTLARARGRSRVPARLAGATIDARWSVTELTLVRSRLDPAGARYEIEAQFPLA